MKNKSNDLMEAVIFAVGGVVSIAFLLCLCATLFSLPFMLLWNWLIPPIFGLVKITFWQALGLNLLCGIAFRSKVSTSKKSEK